MNEGTNGGQEPQTGWQFHQDDAKQGVSPALTAAPAAPAPETPPEVTWQAAEFVVHEKSPVWYLSFALATVLVSAAIFLVSHDIFSLVTVLAVFVLFGWMAARRPRQLTYLIVPDGIVVNGHLHSFATFKSFGVQDEGGISSLVFMPLKRFMLPLYVYYPPEQEDTILSALSQHLPFAPVEQSSLERAAHRLRF